jgi:hypothetical protein
MLPSEKVERWIRRVGFAALVLMALYIVVWLTRFIWGISHEALEQRRHPAESATTGAGQVSRRGHSAA